MRLCLVLLAHFWPLSSLLSIPPVFPMIRFVVMAKAYPSQRLAIASQHLPSFASADLRCVTFRSKKKLAPVRLSFHILHCLYQTFDYKKEAHHFCSLFKMSLQEETITRTRAWPPLRYVLHTHPAL